MRTLQGIDTDLHGTPAFLQSLSVDPDHEKHIDPDLENKCIQTNISGMRQRLPLHFIAVLFRSWLKYSLSVYNNLCACLLQQPDSSAERIKELAEVSSIAPRTTPSIPSLIVLNVTLALRFMLWVVSCISWRVISPRYITVVFRLSSSWTRTTRRLGTGAARLASNWRTLTKPRKVSWELKKCPEERTKMWPSGSNSVTWSWRNLRTRRSGCTRKCSRAKKWLKVNW